MGSNKISNFIQKIYNFQYQSLVERIFYIW